MSINRVCISGNLTRDPELRSTASGMQVLQLGVAVNERVKGQDGQWSDRPNYVDCTMFGNRAEGVSRHLAKGSKVSIEGKLRYSSWEDKNGGGKRSKLEVVVDEIEFMSPQQGQQAAPAPAPYQQQQGYASQPVYAPQPAQGYAPQGYMPQQAQYAPQQGYAPVQQAASQVQQTMGAMQQPMPVQQPSIYDEDIPF